MKIVISITRCGYPNTLRGLALFRLRRSTCPTSRPRSCCSPLVFLSFREEGIQVPFARFARSGDKVEWKPPVYRSLHAALENPVYAGACVFGRTESRTIIVAGHPPEADREGVAKVELQTQLGRGRGIYGLAKVQIHVLQPVIILKLDIHGEQVLPDGRGGDPETPKSEVPTPADARLPAVLQRTTLNAAGTANRPL